MQTSRNLLKVGPMAVQPFKVRNGVSNCRRRHAHMPIYISARAATTMTPAAVVTAEPPTPSSDSASAAMLGPLGKSLLNDAEVRTYVWVLVHSCKTCPIRLDRCTCCDHTSDATHMHSGAETRACREARRGRCRKFQAALECRLLEEQGV